LDENGTVGMEVDPSCNELIRDFEEVLRSPTGGVKKATNRKDPYFFRTHASDGIGYWVTYEQPVISTPDSGFGLKLDILPPRYGGGHRR
jgi:hypothetical protein